MLNDKTIWISGFSAALGHAVAEQLLQADHTVVYARPETPPAAIISAADEDTDHIRTIFPSVPILTLSAHNGFVPPFRLSALLARLHHLLQAGALAGRTSITIGSLTFNPRDKTLGDPNSVGDTQRLTDKESTLLLTLHDAGGKPVARDMLLRHVWAYSDAVDTHTLETHVWRLRQKIEENPANPERLLTEEGGYSLKA